MISRILKTMLISVMFISLILSNSTIQATLTEKTDNPNPKATISNTQGFNTLIKKSYETLDKISSILEFVAQAIKKGSISLRDEAAAKNWIKKNLDNTKALEDNLNNFDIDLVKIYKINSASKLLISHIYQQLDQQLQNIEIIDIDLNANIFRNIQPSKAKPKIIQQLINTNLKNIINLQNKANEIGLTFVNKASRKIEHLNDKYRISRLLNILPPVVLLSIAALYYMPLSWFGIESTDPQKAKEPAWLIKKIPFFSKIKAIKKYFIGVSKYTDNTMYEQYKTTGNGILHTLLTIWEKDSGKLSTALSLLVAYANKDSLATTFPEAGKFLSAIRDSWQRLKGYEVKDSSRYEIIENITLDDERIIGLGSQKQELKNTLEYIANPEMYDKQQSGPGKAIIIVGPSGNGKTLLAKAVAGSLNKLLKNQGSNNRIAFKEIKWSEVVWTREGLKKVVEQAKAHAPCILFFDEIHTLPLQTKEGSPALSDLLTELDGVNAENSSSNQIIFLAATNQPEMLDKALLRTGRFGSTKITVTKPTFETRKQYFEVMCKRYSIDTAHIDFDLLARQTANCSYSDLDTILKDARFTARREVRRTNQAHIQDRIIKRIYRLTDESSLTTFEKKHLSANKAGSALMHLLLDPQETLEMVTIKGRWKKIKESRLWEKEVKQNIARSNNLKYGGIFTYNPNEELNITDDAEKIKQCKIKIASYLAEEILLQSKSSPIDNNIGKINHKQKALELIKSTLYDPFEKDFMSKKMEQELKEKTYEIFKQYEQEVKDLLKQNYSLLSTIANELEEKELLTMSDLQKLMTNAKQRAKDTLK